MINNTFFPNLYPFRPVDSFIQKGDSVKFPYFMEIHKMNSVKDSQILTNTHMILKFEHLPFKLANFNEKWLFPFVPIIIFVNYVHFENIHEL